MRVSLAITIGGLSLSVGSLLFMAWHKVPRAFIELGLGAVMCGFGMLTSLTVGNSPVGYATQALLSVLMLYWWWQAAIHLKSLKKSLERR